MDRTLALMADRFLHAMAAAPTNTPRLSIRNIWYLLVVDRPTVPDVVIGQPEFGPARFRTYGPGYPQGRTTRRTPMGIRFGLALSSEEHPPQRLVQMAQLAEDNGFDVVGISDHYHPWISAQGHSPFVWSVLGAIAQATERIGVGVGVTCPTVRIHPAVLAQATATTASLLPGRFTWGVGSGEALNEHIFGDRWPPAPLRLEMLEEAIAVIRELWTGESVTFYGEHYTVENARIFDLPPEPPPIVVSAFGPLAARVAARSGDGLWVVGPGDDETLETWRGEGGEGPLWSQITLCWASDTDTAVETAHRLWPNSGIPGQLSQDLPTPLHFEEASQTVTRDQVAESVPCGPDPRPVLRQVEQAIGNGADHVYLHQIGPDQEGFARFWQDELAPALASHRDR
jgi:coenzyme F420-dependent glucose-6-phosphate dehydrogenase